MKKKVNFKDLERQKAKYYREQIEEAKKQFLDETGKKVARGFTQTDDYKRIIRNQKRAFRRLEKKKIQSFATGQKRKLKGAKVVAKEVRTTGRNKFYWEMLGTENEAITEWREAEQAGGLIPGSTLFGVVIDYKGNRQVYFTEFQFARAISDLLKEAAKLQERVTLGVKRDNKKKGSKTPDHQKQRKTTHYPQVELSIIEDSNGAVYIIVRGVPKNEAIV